MDSQDTIEDLTLYQDMHPTSDVNKSNEAAVMEDDPHSIRSASHILESPPERKEYIQDDEEDKERTRDQSPRTADSAPSLKLERVLLFVIQLNLQLKKCAEETANSHKGIAKCLEELEDDLRNDSSKTKDSTQRYRQVKGILKRVKRQGDNEDQLVGNTQREVKRARVTWADQEICNWKGRT
ncbi:hypothetical protein EJ07DRAFT_122303 [Lizonia empirigonia]|nr:hypothetical protein EJ07DRAFT_122303 [Lizonia empirigonia]